MKKSRFSDEQIIGFPGQAEAGAPISGRFSPNARSHKVHKRTSPTLRASLLLAFAVLVLPPAYGADQYTPEFGRCMKSSGGVTSQMMDCVGAELKVQDTKLNASYKVLSARVSEARRKALVEAQRAWLRFRDLNCTFYADPDGGTSALISANECLLRLTAARAKELQALVP